MGTTAPRPPPQGVTGAPGRTTGSAVRRVRRTRRRDLGGVRHRGGLGLAPERELRRLGRGLRPALVVDLHRPALAVDPPVLPPASATPAAPPSTLRRGSSPRKGFFGESCSSFSLWIAPRRGRAPSTG